MSHSDFKEGFGIVERDGLNVRTVSDTRRAAIVIWLHIHNVYIFSSHSDDHINALWDANCGDAMVRPVRLYVQ